MAKKTEHKNNPSEVKEVRKTIRKAAVACVTAEDDLVLLQEKYEHTRREYSDLVKLIGEVRGEYQRLMKCIESQRMLLASYGVIVEGDNISVVTPNIGDVYYYIRSSFGSERFDVIEKDWTDGFCDRFRHVTGNFFLDKHVAHVSAAALNSRLTTYVKGGKHVR